MPDEDEEDEAAAGVEAEASYVNDCCFLRCNGSNNCNGQLHEDQGEASTA